jgi:site-specific recombinase XerC
VTATVYVGGVIADFLRDAERGIVRAAADRPHTPRDVRELRAALGHVDAELGTERVRAVTAADVEALVERLRAAGLSERRLDTIVEALRALDAYAAARRLDRIPVPRSSSTPREEPIGAPSAPPRAPAATPTQAMLALGERAGTWTVRLVVAGFLLVAVLLVTGVD